MAQYGAAERRNLALQMLRNNGHVSVSELSKALSVSDVTIRKDLQFLEEHHLLLRTRGGAMVNDRMVRDQPLEEKGRQYSDEKRRIGLAAADLVEDGDTIMMDAGTTTLQVARSLQSKRNLTVLTSSVNLASELLPMNGIEVVMLGGVVRPTSASVVGHYAEQMIKEHSCRKFFLAVDGFDVERGLTTTNSLEAHLNRLMIEASFQTIVVTDSSKFGRRGLSRICGYEDIDKVVTDSAVPESAVKFLSEHEVEVIVV
jgi:DeoR family transcriptional regulator, aga operon transcriptional repressor